MIVLLWLVVTILIILVLIMKFKLNAAISMFLACLFMGIASGVSMLDTVKAITVGFGNTMAGIGLSIGFGVMLGQLTADTGAVQVIANKMLSVFGEKRADTALGLTGFIVSIPVFFDVGFVIMMPLAKALATASNKKTLPHFIGALSAGLCVAHCMIPPTPGPLAAAATMGVSAGAMIGMGIVVGLPTFALTMFIYGRLLAIKGFWNPATCERVLSAEEQAANEKAQAELMRDESKLPGFGASMVPIALPIVLILIGTVWSTISPNVPQIVSLIASKEVAMVLGVFAALLLSKGRRTEKEIEKSFNDAMASTGLILLITGAGGSLGNILTVAGVGTVLNELLVTWSMPVIIFTWLVGVIIRMAQGSGTVAMITAAGIIASMGSNLGANPVLITLAACSGAVFVGHVNDSGFWVVANCGGLTVEGGLKTYCVANTLISVISLVFILLLSLVM